MQEEPRPANGDEKLEALLAVCRAGKPIYILTHDHPDPDAMASAACVQYLVKQVLKLRSRIVFGGLVERPENRTMKSHLRTTFSQVPSNLFTRDITLVMVDTQPGAGNNPVPEKYKPAAVLDHHPLRRETRQAAFYDVRPKLGACATLMYGYLKSAGVAVPRTLATALCYAITSETQDLGREALEQDINAYVELLSMANVRKLSRIEHSRVPKEYFLILHSAVEKAFVYKEVIGTRLGRVSRPDLAAQMADLLLTLERMKWSICTAAFKDRLYVSIRTTKLKARCLPVIRKVLGKDGSAGGHGMLAGGYIPITGLTSEEVNELERTVMLRMIRAVAPPGIEHLPPLKEAPEEEDRKK
jgi:nanoRNase/pAp phosphatase (c-di-AMP/oligoRNAs hydrolase)